GRAGAGPSSPTRRRRARWCSPPACRTSAPPTRPRARPSATGRCRWSPTARSPRRTAASTSKAATPVPPSSPPCACRPEPVRAGGTRASAPRPVRLGQTGVMEPLGVHHVSVNVTDVEAALRFYVDELGFEPRTDRPDFGFGGAWLDVGGQQVHLIEAP